jgi:hypothetical protein
MRVGIFQNGIWTFDENGNGILDAGIDAQATFGGAGDQPVTGDWAGSGRTNIGVFRNGEWFLDYDGNRVWNDTIDKHYVFGQTGDRACTGDWSGAGHSNIGVLRGVGPNNGIWYLDLNGNGVIGSSEGPVYYGLAADLPVPGPWGPGSISYIGIFRNGQWDVDINGNRYWDPDRSMLFGVTGDLPIVFKRL